MLSYAYPLNIRKAQMVIPILPESPEFCRRYYKKHFDVYFLGHSIYDIMATEDSCNNQRFFQL